MSNTMNIRESETGIVRVFHLDLPPEAIERYTTQAGTGEWPLMYGLGAKKLSSAFVDIVDIRDLEGMPLTTYLSSAHNLAPETLAASAAQLDRLRGHVLVLPSQAFMRTAQSIHASTPLRWIGTFEEIKAGTTAVPLKSKAAKKRSFAGKPEKRKASDTLQLKIMLAGIAIAVVLLAWVIL